MTATPLVWLWCKAFVLTLLCEVPLVLLALRWVGGPGPWETADRARLVLPPTWRLLLLAGFASLATHPLVWFIFPELPLAPWNALWLSEAWAVLAEGLFYWLVLPGLRLPWAGLLSLTANACSFGLGLLLYEYAPWILR